MNLNIDFYSKDEVSVYQDLDGSYQNNSEQLRNLLLFSTFLARVYHNFGHQPVGKVLSCILRHFDQDDYQKLIDGKFKFLNPAQLRELLIKDQVDPGVDLDVFEKMIFQPMPKLVSPRLPKGKYSFHLSLSPCILDLRGFNMVSIDLNYYLFQAIFPAIYNAGTFCQSMGYPPDLIVFAVNFISAFYQRLGPEHMFNAEGFALDFIKSQILKQGN